MLREVAAAIFMENRSPSSNGRAGLIGATRPALGGSLAGFGLEIIGIGAAIENMRLAAEALGVRIAFMSDVVIAEGDIDARHRRRPGGCTRARVQRRAAAASPPAAGRA